MRKMIRVGGMFNLSVNAEGIMKAINCRASSGRFIIATRCIERRRAETVLSNRVRSVNEITGAVGRMGSRLRGRAKRPLRRIYVTTTKQMLGAIAARIRCRCTRRSIIANRSIRALSLLNVRGTRRTLGRIGSADCGFCYIKCSAIGFFLGSRIFVDLRNRGTGGVNRSVVIAFLPRSIMSKLCTTIKRTKLDMTGVALRPVTTVGITVPRGCHVLGVTLISIKTKADSVSVAESKDVVTCNVVPRTKSRLARIVIRRFLISFGVTRDVGLRSAADSAIACGSVVDVRRAVPTRSI